MVSEQESFVDAVADRLRAVIREEIEAGGMAVMNRALTDEAAKRFAEVAMDVVQRRWEERAGQFLFSGIKGLATKLFWWGLFVLLAVNLGGWALVKSVWSSMTKGG